MELIAAVTALKSPVLMQTRVGIATGLVVVGDLIGSGEGLPGRGKFCNRDALVQWR
jgi:hypothetical protein